MSVRSHHILDWEGNSHGDTRAQSIVYSVRYQCQEQYSITHLFNI